jgi:hypothetical protein
MAHRKSFWREGARRESRNAGPAGCYIPGAAGTGGVMKLFSGFKALPINQPRFARSRDKNETLKWRFGAGLSTSIAGAEVY